MQTVQPMTGAHEITLAVDQEQYEPLIVALHWNDALRSPVLVSRWKLSDEERARIVAGEDFYLGLVTFNQPVQPVMVTVGVDAWRDGAIPGEEVSP